MERWSVVFTCHVYLNILVIFVSGITMHNCTGGWIDIPEDTLTFITCSNISKGENVTWTVENDLRNETIFNTVCGSIAVCNSYITNEISIQSYKDDGASLVIDRNHRRYGGFTVTCSTTTEHAECRMHVFHPAKVNHCQTDINTRSWRVTAACYFNKFFSSREKARCGEYMESSMLEQSLKNYTRFDRPLHLQNYTDKRNNNTYQKGICSFTSDLPTSAGNYSYIINIVPGTALETAGKVLVDKSETNCTTFLEENPRGRCECFKRDPGSFPTTPHSHTGATASYVCNLVMGSTSHSGQPPHDTTPQPHLERTTSRPPLETTREMYTEQPTQTPVKSSQGTHVTTFPNPKGLASSPSDQIDSSLSPQNKLDLSVTTGVIAGVAVAVVLTVIVIAAIVYGTRRHQNRSTTSNTSFNDNTQHDAQEFEEQINAFYISADALALNGIRPVDDLSQSRVQDSVAQLSPQTSSNFTDKGCMVQTESNSSASLPVYQTQTTQPCLKELERKQESTMSNTEDFYAVVADKDLRGSKP